jgi:hypothetical protein
MTALTNNVSTKYKIRSSDFLNHIIPSSSPSGIRNPILYLQRISKFLVENQRLVETFFPSIEGHDPVYCCTEKPSYYMVDIRIINIQYMYPGYLQSPCYQ